MALEPTVFQIHIKVISGTTPAQGSITIPDFLFLLSAAASGAKVNKTSDELQCVYNLSKKLEEIKGAAECSLTWPPAASSTGNSGWVASPYCVVSKGTDQKVGENPNYVYEFTFDSGEIVEVEFSVSLAFA